MALYMALAGFGALVFTPDEYERAHYHVATWSLVFLACFPRRAFRWSMVLIIPFVTAGLVAAYAWNWLARNTGEGDVANLVALLALAFGIEGCVATVRKLNELGNRPVRKW